jgi:glutamate-1-semialdehyde 2,1-aminomutase
MLLFDDDPELARGNLFADTALRYGVYLHPWHNMFLSLAHTEADIDQALDATDKALAAVAQRFG